MKRHHRPGGGFRNPWTETADGRHAGAFLRWRLERLFQGGGPRRPPAGALPLVRPALAPPGAQDGIARVTWIGHATFLIQVDGLNLLTDPHLSERASPVSWAGPRRIVPPALTVEDLPPIDAVLLSHDHYDHLDVPSVRGLVERFGAALEWITPLGYAPWFASFGVRHVRELDWGDATRLDRAAGAATIHAVPARHWTRRSPFERPDRLWAAFAIDAGKAGRVFFGGDSGWFPEYGAIGEAHGPFDIVLLPIGAYAPRWFMQAAHMDPAEAVRAYCALGGAGTFVPMHWGTFMLSDESVLEPPERLRSEWAAAGLRADDLAILRHGETLAKPAAPVDPVYGSTDPATPE